MFNAYNIPSSAVGSKYVKRPIVNIMTKISPEINDNRYGYVNDALIEKMIDKKLDRRIAKNKTIVGKM
jgi:hypothetical protein